MPQRAPRSPFWGRKEKGKGLGGGSSRSRGDSPAPRAAPLGSRLSPRAAGHHGRMARATVPCPSPPPLDLLPAQGGIPTPRSIPNPWPCPGLSFGGEAASLRASTSPPAEPQSPPARGTTCLDPGRRDKGAARVAELGIATSRATDPCPRVPGEPVLLPALSLLLAACPGSSPSPARGGSTKPSLPSLPALGLVCKAPGANISVPSGNRGTWSPVPGTRGGINTPLADVSLRSGSGPVLQDVGVPIDAALPSTGPVLPPLPVPAFCCPAFPRGVQTLQPQHPCFVLGSAPRPCPSITGSARAPSPCGELGPPRSSHTGRHQESSLL